ncbi:Tyrosine recombinase XerD [Caballeronia choica]|uniref:Tyrosine recombinase XerD n=1 Tax=Caballeronia choica TaxID=326476 RepID=A0A158KPE9_9BURK|nr:tyrosine-type recombinase/integrase [Caballeronia choica]SAL82470.1 Tyrosine recombinase XerD [Caballeronia choica]
MSTKPKHNLTSKTGRAALEARREPYWARIEAGLFLGFRVAARGGAGTWIARRRNEHGKQEYRALGAFDDYDGAKAAAEQWARNVEHGASAKPATVKEACATYVAHLRLHKGAASAADAEGRFRRLIDDAPIGSAALDKLRTTQVRAWLQAQVKAAQGATQDATGVRRARDSANRNLAALKAALNLALRDRLVASDAGWATVGKFENVGRRREGVLTAEQIGALLEHLPADLRALVEAMAHIPSRPGELSALRVRDFDRQQGTLAISGKTGFRVVPLSTAAVAFLTAQSTDKLANAYIFTQAHGVAWTRHAWKKPFRAAVLAAALPAETVLYSLRHASITGLVASGIDSVLVARLAGTSVGMIQKHYEHADGARVRALLDSVPALVRAK